MGLFKRVRAATSRGSVHEPLSSPSVITAVWLPGRVEVQVVGETNHADAIRKAEQSTGHEPIAELIPQPDNPHDSNAVAVNVNDFHVGYLSRQIVPKVQPALVAFAAANSGRHVSCPARILWHDFDDQVVAEVVLLLDSAPLGLAASVFDHAPELDQVIHRQLSMLDHPAPTLTGRNAAARELLATAKEQREAVEADYDREPGAWMAVEKAFLEAARPLETSRDPRVSDAWAGVAGSRRYQKGKRDGRIEAAVTAIYWDRANEDAWSNLFDLAAAAPHILTLLEMFKRVPLETRPPILSQLLALSSGHDRLGKMHAEAGERLRASLLTLAEEGGDKISIRKLRRWITTHPPRPAG
jgi:HIRAN domain-containing protein